MDEIGKKLEDLTLAISELTARVANIESRAESHDSHRPSESVDQGRVPIVVTERSTVDSETAVSSFDNTSQQFEGLRDRLHRIQVPQHLKVNESSVGLKQEARPTLKILSKCARHSETGLKLLSTLRQDDDGTFALSEDDMQNLFVIFASQCTFFTI